MNVFTIAVVALTVSLGVRVTAAEELPTFQQGLWSFQRTVLLRGKPAGPAQSVQQCTDPSADMKKKWASLTTKGCQFSLVSRSDQRYSYQSTCSISGTAISTKSLVVVSSDSDYRVTSDAYNGGQVSQTVIVAHRVGDCAK